MVYILIALVASSFIFEYWLLAKINKLKKENQNLQIDLQLTNLMLIEIQQVIIRVRVKMRSI